MIYKETYLERNKSMIFNKQITENITLVYGELNNWKYDENDIQYPRF